MCNLSTKDSIYWQILWFWFRFGVAFVDAPLIWTSFLQQTNVASLFSEAIENQVFNTSSSVTVNDKNPIYASRSWISKDQASVVGLPLVFQIGILIEIFVSCLAVSRTNVRALSMASAMRYAISACLLSVALTIAIQYQTLLDTRGEFPQKLFDFHSGRLDLTRDCGPDPNQHETAFMTFSVYSSTKLAGFVVGMNTGSDLTTAISGDFVFFPYDRDANTCDTSKRQRLLLEPFTRFSDSIQTILKRQYSQIYFYSNFHWFVTGLLVIEFALALITFVVGPCGYDRVNPPRASRAETQVELQPTTTSRVEVESQPPARETQPPPYSHVALVV